MRFKGTEKSNYFIAFQESPGFKALKSLLTTATAPQLSSSLLIHSSLRYATLKLEKRILHLIYLIVKKEKSRWKTALIPRAININDIQ